MWRKYCDDFGQYLLHGQLVVPASFLQRPKCAGCCRFCENRHYVTLQWIDLDQKIIASVWLEIKLHTMVPLMTSEKSRGPPVAYQCPGILGNKTVAVANRESTSAGLTAAYRSQAGPETPSPSLSILCKAADGRRWPLVSGVVDSLAASIRCGSSINPRNGESPAPYVAASHYQQDRPPERALNNGSNVVQLCNCLQYPARYQPIGSSLLENTIDDRLLRNRPGHTEI